MEVKILVTVLGGALSMCVGALGGAMVASKECSWRSFKIKAALGAVLGLAWCAFLGYFTFFQVMF